MPEDFTYVQRIIYPEIFFNVCILLVIIREIRRAWTTQLMLLGRGPQPCGYQIHDRIGKPTSLHVDKVIKNVLAPPLAKSLWNDIIEQSNSIAVSKECQSLCFENIVLNCTCMAVQSFKFCHLSCSSPISGSERPDSQPKSACQAGWSFYCLTAPHSKGTFCTF